MRGTKAVIYVLMAFIALVAITGACLALWRNPFTDTTGLGILFTLLALVLTAPLAATMHRTQYRIGAITLAAIFALIWGFWILGMANLDDKWAWLTGEKIEESVGVLFVVGLPAAVAFMCGGKPWARYLRWGAGITAGVCGAIALFAIWTIPTATDGERDLNEKLIAGAGWAALCGAFISALLINVGQRDRRYFRWPAIAIALIALITGLIVNAQDAARMFSLTAEKESHWLHLIADISFWAAGTFALINMILMTRCRGAVRLIKWIAVLFCLCAGATLITTVLCEFPDSSAYESAHPYKWQDRDLAASTFLLTGSVICLILVRTCLRFKSKITAHEGVDRLEIRCPNCGVLQEMGLSGSCRKCLLRFNISIADPRCPGCDHLLLNLESDRCPECGLAFRRPGPPAPPMLAAAVIPPA